MEEPTSAALTLACVAGSIGEDEKTIDHGPANLVVGDVELELFDRVVAGEVVVKALVGAAGYAGEAGYSALFEVGDIAAI